MLPSWLFYSASARLPFIDGFTRSPFGLAKYHVSQPVPTFSMPCSERTGQKTWEFQKSSLRSIRTPRLIITQPHYLQLSLNLQDIKRSMIYLLLGFPCLISCPIPENQLCRSHKILASSWDDRANGRKDCKGSAADYKVFRTWIGRLI